MTKPNVDLIALLFLAISAPSIWGCLSIVVNSIKGKVIAGDVDRNDSPVLYWFIVVAAFFAMIPLLIAFFLASIHFVLKPFHA